MQKISYKIFHIKTHFAQIFEMVCSLLASYLLFILRCSLKNEIQYIKHSWISRSLSFCIALIINPINRVVSMQMYLYYSFTFCSEKNVAFLYIDKATNMWGNSKNTYFSMLLVTPFLRSPVEIKYKIILQSMVIKITIDQYRRTMTSVSQVYIFKTCLSLETSFDLELCNTLSWRMISSFSLEHGLHCNILVGRFENLSNLLLDFFFWAAFWKISFIFVLLYD